MNDRQLSVRLNGMSVGTLEMDASGRMSFRYLPEAARQISLAMPLTEEPYGHNPCEAFFGGLLPESEQARQAIGRRFGISANNTFRILQAIGYDCAGAISLHDPSEPEAESQWHDLEAKPLSARELARHIEELPKRPLFVGVEGVRLSLAGAQDKAAVCLVDGEVALPQKGTPTTHLLKPPIERYEETVQNEYLCMRTARRLGLNAAPVEIREAGGIPYILIERYDREISEDGRIRRVHQEDFCQALGVATLNKYESDGGPGFVACFKLLMAASRPALERNRMAEVMVFNYLCGNWDAHGKNFSLLHRGSGEITMASFYDILCLSAYPDLAQKMAMRIDKYYDPDRIQPRHWEQLCKTIGFGFPALKRVIQRLAGEMPAALQSEIEELQGTRFNTTIPARMLESITTRCQNIQQQLWK